MQKIKTGWKYPILPLPICILGTTVNGKPNFNTIAWFNMLDSKPPIVGVAMSKKHYSNEGIRKNQTFSINIPSADMVTVTDYCGINSGAEVDKSELFEVFYGDLETAPMIKDCISNIECQLKNTIDFKQTEMFIGEIVDIYINENLLTNDTVNFENLNLFIFLMPNGPYLRVGEYLAKAYDVGKSYNKEK